MKRSHLTMIVLLGAAIAAPSFAQPGPGKGMGFAFDKGNTVGWALMTAEERSAHRAKMFAAKSYDECKAVQDEQHKAMEARAAEKGVTLAAPRQNACDRMQAKGKFK